MKILIHACPQRMWYVEGYLIPSMLAQGLPRKSIEIWNDTQGLGNLASCMSSFAWRSGNGGTWHIQDDVLISRDFVQRCRQHDKGVVYGFCCEQFQDDPAKTGTVAMPDAWHSFQCVRIPDAWARECAEWYELGAWQGRPNPELPLLAADNKGDDSFFHEFLEDRHGGETALNLAPNLVEHVDWIIGGSVLHPWRGYLARACYWDDEDLVDALRRRIRACPT